MRQTLALLVDAYRELNARKMFWITLILSGLVVAAFAVVGINEQGLTLLWWQFEIDEISTRIFPRDVFYKFLFVYFGIGFWLSFVAVILALVSTASIYPDLVSSGSIDLLLSKPISRLRLFLTKFVCGLLFVFLQVSIFSVASFLVIGMRGGSWEPALLLAVPVVTVFYSYLFSMCALLGVITRSAIASLLLTLLVWFLIFIVNSGESWVLMAKISEEVDIERSEQRIVTYHDQIEDFEAVTPQDESTAQRITELESQIQTTEDGIASSQGTVGTLDTVHDILFGVKTLLPKTSETVGLLERWLIDLADLPNMDEQGPQPPQNEVNRRLAETIQSRSVWWVAGTSLLFEFVMLTLGAWIFLRRDF